VNWDYLLIDISSEAGQFVVLPASSATKYRIDKLACQVIFEELMLRYAQLADSEIEDNGFAQMAEAEERSLFRQFAEAAHSTDLRGLRAVLISGGVQEDPLEDVVL
jgi:hypothetical protein